MKRLFEVQSKILEKIEEYVSDNVERDYPLSYEKIHMVSSSTIAQILAVKRGVDPELSAIACSFHDYGRIITGKQSDHANVGYGPLKEFLTKFDNLTLEEKEMIALVSKNHSSKKDIGTPIEEIIKDADVLDCWYYGIELVRDEQKKRLEKILLEM